MTMIDARRLGRLGRCVFSAKDFMQLIPSRAFSAFPEGTDGPTAAEGTSVPEQIRTMISSRMENAWNFRKPSRNLATLYAHVLQQPNTLLDSQSVVNGAVGMRAFAGAGVQLDESLLQRAVEKVLNAKSGTLRERTAAAGHLIYGILESDRTFSSNGMLSSLISLITDNANLKTPQNCAGNGAAAVILATAITSSFGPPAASKTAAPELSKQLNLMLGIASLNETDLTIVDVLSLKYAYGLLSHGIKGLTEELDLRSKTFLQTGVLDSPVTEKMPHITVLESGRVLTTDFEDEVSQALSSVEVPNDTAPSLLGPCYFTLKAPKTKTIYLCEGDDSFYKNTEKETRLAVHKWRYRLAQHEGWKIVAAANKRTWPEEPEAQQTAIQKAITTELKF